MYKEGRLNLKKAKALIAEEKAEKKIKKTNVSVNISCSRRDPCVQPIKLSHESRNLEIYSVSPNKFHIKTCFLYLNLNPRFHKIF